MKTNINRLPKYQSLALVTGLAMLSALGILAGQHAQAASLSLDQNFNTPFFASEVLGSRAVLLPDGKYVMFFNLDTLAAGLRAFKGVRRDYAVQL